MVTCPSLLKGGDSWQPSVLLWLAKSSNDDALVGSKSSLTWGISWFVEIDTSGECSELHDF